MAYNVAANLRQTRPGAAFLDARDRVQQNALAERQVAGSEQAVQFSQNRLMQQDKDAQDQAAQAQEMEELKQGYAAVQRIRAAPPGQKRVVASAVFDDEDRAEFASEGINFDALDDNGLDELALKMESEFGSALGIGPAAPPKRESYTLNPGDVRFEDGKEVARVAPNQPTPAKAPGTYRTLSEAEIRAAGLPAGTSAQVGPDNKIDILNKREGLSAAEQKTVREAKMRMPRLDAAIRRADRLGKAVTALSDNWFFDGGPADARALSVTKEGRELMAASAQLMPELQALTRVPGIGSQSDLEARLASLALPSLEMDPETNRRTQDELVSFIADLKSAYASLIESDQPAATQSTVAGAPPKETAAQRAARLGL
jgi:hypothetical protein